MSRKSINKTTWVKNNASRIRDMASDLVRVLRTTPHFNDWATTDVTFERPDMAQRLPIAEGEINNAINEANRNHIRVEVSQSSKITYLRAPPRSEHDWSHNRSRRRRRNAHQDWPPPTQAPTGALPQDIQPPTDQVTHVRNCCAHGHGCPMGGLKGTARQPGEISTFPSKDNATIPLQTHQARLNRS